MPAVRRPFGGASGAPWVRPEASRLRCREQGGGEASRASGGPSERRRGRRFIAPKLAGQSMPTRRGWPAALLPKLHLASASRAQERGAGVLGGRAGACVRPIRGASSRSPRQKKCMCRTRGKACARRLWLEGGQTAHTPSRSLSTRAADTFCERSSRLSVGYPQSTGVKTETEVKKDLFRERSLHVGFRKRSRFVPAEHLRRQKLC